MSENIALYTRLGYVETHRQTAHGFGRVFFTKRTRGNEIVRRPWPV